MRSLAPVQPAEPAASEPPPTETAPPPPPPAAAPPPPPQAQRKRRVPKAGRPFIEENIQRVGYASQYAAAKNQARRYPTQSWDTGARGCYPTRPEQRLDARPQQSRPRSAGYIEDSPYLSSPLLRKERSLLHDSAQLLSLPLSPQQEQLVQMMRSSSSSSASLLTGSRPSSAAQLGGRAHGGAARTAALARPASAQAFVRSPSVASSRGWDGGSLGGGGGGAGSPIPMSHMSPVSPAVAALLSSGPASPAASPDAFARQQAPRATSWLTADGEQWHNPFAPVVREARRVAIDEARVPRGAYGSPERLRRAASSAARRGAPWAEELEEVQLVGERWRASRRTTARDAAGRRAQRWAVAAPAAAASVAAVSKLRGAPTPMGMSIVISPRGGAPRGVPSAEETDTYAKSEDWRGAGAGGLGSGPPATAAAPLEPPTSLFGPGAADLPVHDLVAPLGFP